MQIICPLCGPRDLREFQYLGDAKLLARPDASGVELATAPELQAEFHDYLHIRDNPAGVHDELWYHEFGCQSWLRAQRDTVTHKFARVVPVTGGAD